jgi:hypothetical protein
MTKYKLIGAIILSAILVSAGPVKAAIVTERTDRRNADSTPSNSSALTDVPSSKTASISQGSGNSGIEEMATKKKKKKKKTKAS